MGYTYDNRPRKAAKDADKDETLENLVSTLEDAIRLADSIDTELSKRVDTDLSAASKIASDLSSDLQICESVETVKDFVANIQEARKNLGLLETALRKPKKDAKADGDTAALDAIEEATDALKELKREMKAIEDEIAAGEEDTESDE